MQKPLKDSTVLVVGAGIMGAGIAQVAAQSGHPVLLHDSRPGLASQAHQKLAETLEALVAKGRLEAPARLETLARIQPIADLSAAAEAGLVIEAIVEDLEAKRRLFRELENIVSQSTILASNTSSISITALANGLQSPERLVGMHFFNPVPLMKLVEVVSGLSTAPEVAQAIFELSRSWGKVPVHAKSTPGFIVNRIARPYYAEALKLLQERALSPEALDACLQSAGFKMGPCALMDLIGHDTNFSVTQSVFQANFFDQRYQPSLLQKEMVEGGLLGRKTGQGFFSYPEGAPSLGPIEPVSSFDLDALAQASEGSKSGAEPPTIILHGSGAFADRLQAAFEASETLATFTLTREAHSPWIGFQYADQVWRMTDGPMATEIALATQRRNVLVFDLVPPSVGPAPKAIAYSVSASAEARFVTAAPLLLAALGFKPLRIEDNPGLVVARTISMLINEASDAVLQGVCTQEGADAAMRLGVNYPQGPFEWLSQLGVHRVCSIIKALDEQHRGDRYRLSPSLRRSSLIPAW